MPVSRVVGAEAPREDIESHLTEVKEEAEQVRASIRMNRNDFKLAEESGRSSTTIGASSLALSPLPHGGLQAVLNSQCS